MTRRAHITQFAFDKGVIDEELLGRRDIRAWPGGCRQAVNMTGLIGGPMTRRGGFAFVAELPEAADGARIAGFQFRLEQAYLLAFTDGMVRVWRDDVLQTPDGIATPLTAAMLDALDYDQSLDTMLLVHEDVAPQQLQRQGAHDAWAVSAVPFRNLPTHPFDGVTEGSATPSHASGNNRTVTSTEPDFASAEPGDTVRINNGRLRITTVNSDTQATGDIEEALDNTATAKPGEWSVEAPVWSDARGWPRSVHLDENRSYWGGSRELLQRVWGSASGGVDIFDFRETKEALEDEFVEADLVGSRVNAVGHVVSLGDQFVFTSGGVFVNSVLSDKPVTPENFRPRKQAPGAVAAIKPAVSDGAITCVMADGANRAVGCADIVFDLTRDGYRAEDLNILSAGVMRRPVDLAARESDGVRQANQRFVVNADGTVAVHHSLRSQNVSGWTLWRTPGAGGADAVLRTAVVGNAVYFLVRREIGGSPRWFIERHDPGRLFDCSVRASFAEPSDTLDGLDHLEGESVEVWADGALRDRATVSGGAVQIADGGASFAASEVEAGLRVDWVLEPLPIEAQIAAGTLVGQKHRLMSVVLEVKDAYPFTVSGGGAPVRQVALRRFGQFSLDAGARAFSGRLRRIRFLGWNRGEGASFTLRGFLPATILSAVAEVGQ